jgi:DNA-binding MarR family transcriptional regulator
VDASADLLRLDETLNTLAALYQFRSTEDRLYGALTVSQSYCLRMVYVRGPRTMGQLAAELGVRLSTMTGVVDQLEARGLVERAPHPDDRRSLRVQLTGKGRRLYQGAHAAFLSHLGPLLEGRTAKEREGFLRFLEGVIGAVKGWRTSPRKARRRGAAHP